MRFDWTLDDGGSPITHYDIDGWTGWYPGETGYQEWFLDSPTLDGPSYEQCVTLDVDFQIRVRAYNAAGPSEYSGEYQIHLPAE